MLRTHLSWEILWLGDSRQRAKVKIKSGFRLLHDKKETFIWRSSLLVRWLLDSAKEEKGSDFNLFLICKRQWLLPVVWYSQPVRIMEWGQIEERVEKEPSLNFAAPSLPSVFLPVFFSRYPWASSKSLNVWVPNCLLATWPGCYGLNCHPMDTYIGILILVPQNANLFWRWGLWRGNHVKMKSLGWTLIKYDWSPYKKGKFETDTHIAFRTSCEPKMGISKSRRKSWNRAFLHSTQKEPILLTLTSSFQNCEAVHFCPLSLSLVVFCYGSPADQCSGVYISTCRTPNKREPLNSWFM
jgi:hypothetical protein